MFGVKLEDKINIYLELHTKLGMLRMRLDVLNKELDRSLDGRDSITFYALCRDLKTLNHEIWFLEKYLKDFFVS